MDSADEPGAAERALALSADALQVALAALDGARALGTAEALSWSLNRLGAVFEAMGASEPALDLLRQAVAAAEQADSEAASSSALYNLGSTLSGIAARRREQGDVAGMRPHAQEALVAIRAASVRAASSLARQIDCIDKEARLLEMLGDLDGMIAAIERRQALAAGLPHLWAPGELLRAGWLLAGGRAEEAMDRLELSLGVAQAQSDDDHRRNFHDIRWRAAKAAGRAEQALDSLERLLEIERRDARRRIEAQGRMLLREAEMHKLRQEVHRKRERAPVPELRVAEAGSAGHQDSLTGLANRRALDLRLNEWLHRDEMSLAAAMVDIDHFKNINDNCGQALGERVLSEVAQLLQQELRGSDFVARNSGAEFVVLIGNQTLAGAVEACERLRQRVAGDDWSALLPGAAPVTISLGLSAARTGDDPSSLLSRAAAAVVRAKRAGRNRLVVDGT